MKYLGEIDATKANRLKVPTFTNLAAFPSAASSEGSLGYADDTNAIYYSNGTVWLLLVVPPSASVISNGGTVVVPDGTFIEAIVIESQPGSRTAKIGTSPGAEDIMEMTTIPTNTDMAFTLNRYTSASLTLHFALTGGTANVIIFTKSKT